MKILQKISLLLIAVVCLQSCEVDDTQTIEKKNWQMVWNDEFNEVAGTQPNSSKWVYDLGNSGWGNNELQYYTDRPQNIATDGNGNLLITAKRENFGTANFTSARIKTQNLFSQQYGRFEARIKTPYGPGIWPAFWLLGDKITTEGWPQCGEIDIMELRGQHPYKIYGTLHGPGYSGGNAITNSYSLSNARFDTDFHLFAIEWNTSYIDYFVDDYMYQRIYRDDVNGNWVYDHPFFIILNVAVGGNFVGYPTGETPFPQTMYIDYVRVYKEQ